MYWHPWVSKIQPSLKADVIQDCHYCWRMSNDQTPLRQHLTLNGAATLLTHLVSPEFLYPYLFPSPVWLSQYNISQKSKSLSEKFHEKFSWSFREKQLELTFRIPLIPPTTQSKYSQEALRASNGVSFKGIICKKACWGHEPKPFPMINPQSNVRMRICLHKADTEISLWSFPLPYSQTIMSMYTCTLLVTTSVT